MAVYDYNPAEHSPHDFPASELAFRAGDIIVTYGSVRPDGFYQGKVGIEPSIITNLADVGL